MKNLKTLLMAAACLLLPVTMAQADYKKVVTNDKLAADTVTEGKIYFTASVDDQSTTALMQAIDDLNISYKNLKKIYLYIDSYGGSMDGGKVAYWAVKSSRTPVTAVNLSTVMSAATMIFCAAQDRQSLKGGRFIMHPARMYGKDYSFKPDQLSDFDKKLKGYNQMFADVYKECTTLNDDEIKSVLFSENNKITLLPDEAKAKGVISKLADKTATTPVAYYITDKNSD